MVAESDESRELKKEIEKKKNYKTEIKQSLVLLAVERVQETNGIYRNNLTVFFRG